MFHKKRGIKPRTEANAKCWVKEFILTYNHHAPNFSAGYFKDSKNVKTNNSSTSSHLVSGRGYLGQPLWRGEKKRFSEKHILLEI